MAVIRSKQAEGIIRKNWRILDKEILSGLADVVFNKDDGFRTSGGTRKIQGVADFIVRTMNPLNMPLDLTLAEVGLPSKVYIFIWKKSEKDVCEELQNFLDAAQIVKG